ncbi:MAG TPA: GntR family transcriptional regulator, partial [Anaerolineales bacterium]|nr:GntR family transcriptional regulator [Anaerolineales bacterium]
FWTTPIPPGSQLPSEAELTRLLGVSRVTVREALRRMEERGIVLCRHDAEAFSTGAAWRRSQ